MRYIAVPLFAALAGCATLAGPSAPGDPAVRLIASRAEAGLRRMVLDLGSGETPDFTAVSSGLAADRFEAATLAGTAGAASHQVEYASLGITLAVCAEGVKRLQSAPAADAVKLARGGFSLTCLLPLGGLSLR